jgi:Ca2+-dependent lipid-binding protein
MHTFISFHFLNFFLYLMADPVQFNAPSAQGVGRPEAPQEEIQRQKDNKKEIDKLKSKYDTKTDEDTAKEKMQETPGNILDASGHVHANHEEDDNEKSEIKGALNEHSSNPNAKVWSNDPNDPYADQWKPTSLPKEQQVGNDSSHHHHHNHHDSMERRDSANHHKRHRLGEQPSAFNRTFESTMTELKTIFNTTDDGAPINDAHKSKLSNPTPLLPVQPDELVKNLQIKALKYIIIACLICYFMGRYRFGYIFGSIVISLCAWAYWNLGRISSKGLEWQLEKQECMKTVSIQLMI